MARELAIRIQFPEEHHASTKVMARALTVEVIDATTRQHIGTLSCYEVKSRWGLSEALAIQIVTPHFEVVDPGTEEES